jgi:flagellar basal body-associated protein FliL
MANKAKKKDDDAAEGGDAAKKKKKKKKKMMMIIGGVVVAAAGFFGGGGGEAAEAGPPTTLALEEEADGLILPVGSLTVNLADETPHFARVSFSVVLIEMADPTFVEPKMALLLDAALREMATFSAEELRSVQGQELLRSKLSAQAIALLNTEDARYVKRVILTDLLVQ